jgi:hypothetical protein
MPEGFFAFGGCSSPVGQLPPMTIRAPLLGGDESLDVFAVPRGFRLLGETVEEPTNPFRLVTLPSPVPRCDYSANRPRSEPNSYSREEVDVSEEIEPYIIYRIDGEQMVCALWQTEDGRKALALFLSGDAATSYRESANLGAEWKIFRPAKKVLLQLLNGGYQSGVGHAVLDPGLETAKRIFSIQEILHGIGT